MRIFLRNTRDLEKHFRIKFSKPDIRLHPNELISVEVNWGSRDDCEDVTKFKYANSSHECFGGDFVVNKKRYINIRTVSFEFPDMKNFNSSLFNMSSEFQISFGAENEEEDESVDYQYEYLFFQNTKYGIIAYFAKEGWDNWDKSIKIKKGQLK